MSAELDVGPGTQGLRELVAAELTRPASPTARLLAEAITLRHGDAVAAVLFYGSCLRKQTSEGILDFYVLVDDYGSAYPKSRWLALLNGLLPPNVFYLERPSESGTLRCKYAVVSLADFARLVSPGCLHSYVWARFAQPARLAYCRDDAREPVAEAVAQAVRTLCQRLVVFMPAHGGVQGFSLSALWHEALRRSYTTELRPESQETVRALYAAEPARFDEVGRVALRELGELGWLDAVEARGNSVEVQQARARRFAGRLRWLLLHPVAKLLNFARLLQSAGTFGDWVPYILWKVERHTGEAISLSDRQRRHPLIFGWPILFKLLRGSKLK